MDSYVVSLFRCKFSLKRFCVRLSRFLFLLYKVCWFLLRYIFDMASEERFAGSRDAQSAGGSFWSLRRARQKAARTRVETDLTVPGVLPPPPGLSLASGATTATHSGTVSTPHAGAFRGLPETDEERLERLERKMDQILREELQRLYVAGRRRSFPLQRLEASSLLSRCLSGWAAASASSRYDARVAWLVGCVRRRQSRQRSCGESVVRLLERRESSSSMRVAVSLWTAHVAREREVRAQAERVVLPLGVAAPAREVGIVTPEGYAGDFRSLPAAGWEALYGPLRAAGGHGAAPAFPATEPTTASPSKAFMVIGNMKLLVEDGPAFATGTATAASIARTISLLLPGIEASTVSVELHSADSASVNLAYRVAAGSGGAAMLAKRAIAGWRGHELLCCLNEGLATATGHVFLAIEAKKPSRDLASTSHGPAGSDEAHGSCLGEGIECLERAVVALSRTVDNKWALACHWEALLAAKNRRLRYLGRAGQ